MSKPIDELVVQIKADTKQLQKDLKKVQTKLKVTGATGGAAFGAMAGSMSKLKGGAIAVAAALVGVGVGITKIAQVGSQFEDLKDSLDTVFGSMAAGDVAMQRVFNFAQNTPFQIETATKAFIALKSAGVEPSNRMLQVFADTASTSTDQLGVFEALVRTVQRSASGGLGLEELNMIMDRGIDVLGILNKELGLNKDSIATFGKTAEGAKLITDALINGLERQFGGAMESKMDNLSTVTSNMTISFKQLADDVFKSGLGQFLKNRAIELTQLADAIVKARKVSKGEAVDVDFVTPEFSPRKDIMELNTISAEEENLNRILERKNRLMEENTKFNLLLDKIAPRESETRRRLTEGEAFNDQFSQYGDIIARNNNELDLLYIKEQKIIDIQKERTNSSKDLNKQNIESIDHQGKLLAVTSLLANEFKKMEGNTKDVAFATENFQDVLKTEINGKTLEQMFGAENVEKYWKVFTGGVDKAVTSLTPMQNLMMSIFDSSVADKADIVKNHIADNAESVENLYKALIIAQPQMAILFPTLDKFKKGFEKSSEKLSKLDQTFKDSVGDITALNDIYTILNENMANGTLTQEQATAKLREFLETTGQYGKALAQIGSEVEGLASSFSDDLTDALLNGENALESFKSFAQNVVQAVISSFMELMVIQPIVDAILGAFKISTPKGGVGTGTGTGTGTGGGMGLNFAGGGKVNPNIPVVVGERGAEIFVPHTNGSILNNMNSKNAMGGGSPVNIYQTVSFATGIVPTVRAEVTKMMPQIADVTKAAVQESAMRGGNFRRSLVGG